MVGLGEGLRWGEDGFGRRIRGGRGSRVERVGR